VQVLERQPQIAALLEYAAEAAAGTGRLVLVEGDAGGGKTTLLEEVERRLGGARWWWGACDGLSTPQPLGPVRDVADAIGGPLLDAVRGGATREEVFDALIGALQSGGPTVLVIEDVHWADDATVDLVRFLGRRIQRFPAVVLVTLREEERPARLRLALGDLARQRAVRRVGLPPLTVEAIRHLLDGTGLDATRVHQLTGGNPFFVTEVLAQASDELPVSVRDSVVARLTGLDEAARTTAEAAALLGLRIDPDVLAEVLQDPAPAVDDLVTAGLVTGHARSLQWRHEITRLAVADSVTPVRRRDLHRRALASLSAREADHARLAFHAEEAGDTDAVLVHAPAAARLAASSSAHREAVAHYQSALRCAEGADPRTRALLHDALAEELTVLDRWAEAAEHLDRALGLWHSADDALREGDTMRRLSQACYRLSLGAESSELARRAVDVLEGFGDTPELARALTIQAGDLMVTSRHDASVAIAERAAALAERLDLPDVMSDALDTQACVLSALGRPWEAVMRRALRVALDAGCGQQASRAYTNCYSMYVDELRYDEGERVYLDGAAYCRELDAATFGNCLAASRVEALEALGRWDDALALAAQYVDRVPLSPINEMHFRLGTTRIAARRGSSDAGERLGALLVTARSTEEPQWIVPFALARAEWHWLHGRDDDARADVVTARDVATEPRLIAMTAVWARRTGVEMPDAELRDPWGASARGDHATAHASWERLGNAYEAALALLDGDDPAGWTEAFVRFDRLGARPAADRARRRLRDAGVRTLPHGVRSSTRAHPAGLTAREQEVLDLIRTGATNEEIADSLVISVRTAAHHVSAVLGKLGVASRREAAVEAQRRGLPSVAGVASPR
jgi:DNA-binding CsgD family transcriptional regulator/tetratricopeptide (TPR) repeat protein